jgi:predicted nucleotide-binding protein (sugar kinase/HSP70/actin superfamily)
MKKTKLLNNKIKKAIIVLIVIFAVLKVTEYLYYNVFDSYFKEKLWHEQIEKAKEKNNES